MPSEIYSTRSLLQKIVAHEEILNLKIQSKESLIDNSLATKTQDQLQILYEKLILQSKLLPNIDVMDRLWNNCHYTIIEERRTKIRQLSRTISDAKHTLPPRLRVAQEQRLAICNDLKAYLFNTDSFYNTLLKNLVRKFPLSPLVSSCEQDDLKTQKTKIAFKCLIVLGDLVRYQRDLSVALPNINWFASANHYWDALRIWPCNGLPYNQLAVLYTYIGNPLSAIYYYMRSVAIAIPSPNGIFNMSVLMKTEPWEQYVQVWSQQNVSDTSSRLQRFYHGFIGLHGLVADKICNQTNAISRSACGTSFSSSGLCFAAVQSPTPSVSKPSSPGNSYPTSSSDSSSVVFNGNTGNSTSDVVSPVIGSCSFNTVFTTFHNFPQFQLLIQDFEALLLDSSELWNPLDGDKSIPGYDCSPLLQILAFQIYVTWKLNCFQEQQTSISVNPTTSTTNTSSLNPTKAFPLPSASQVATNTVGTPSNATDTSDTVNTEEVASDTSPFCLITILSIQMLAILCRRFLVSNLSPEISNQRILPLLSIFCSWFSNATSESQSRLASPSKESTLKLNLPVLQLDDPIQCEAFSSLHYDLNAAMSIAIPTFLALQKQLHPISSTVSEGAQDTAIPQSYTTSINTSPLLSLDSNILSAIISTTPRAPLYEELQLEFFLPLSNAHKIVDFNKGPLINSSELAQLERLRKFIQLGIVIAKTDLFKSVSSLDGTVHHLLDLEIECQLLPVKQDGLRVYDTPRPFTHHSTIAMAPQKSKTETLDVSTSTAEESKVKSYANSSRVSDIPVPISPVQTLNTELATLDISPQDTLDTPVNNNELDIQPDESVQIPLDQYGSEKSSDSLQYHVKLHPNITISNEDDNLEGEEVVYTPS